VRRASGPAGGEAIFLPAKKHAPGWRAVFAIDLIPYYHVKVLDGTLRSSGQFTALEATDIDQKLAHAAGNAQANSPNPVAGHHRMHLSTRPAQGGLIIRERQAGPIVIPLLSGGHPKLKVLRAI
jgi:hypothetical protein